jgi:hypothetical protein
VVLTLSRLVFPDDEDELPLELDLLPLLSLGAVTEILGAVVLLVLEEDILFTFVFRCFACNGWCVEVKVVERSCGDGD